MRYIFFPRQIKCVFCGKDITPQNKFVCDDCKPLIPYIRGNICEICGEELHDLSTICNTCKEHKHKYLDISRSCFKYEGKIKSLIISFKFSNSKWLEDYFALELFEFFKRAYPKLDIDYIIPVPLHKNRQKERRYNQAELILKEFKNKGYNVLINVLNKTKPSKEQSTLYKKDRMSNLEGCFDVVEGVDLKDKIILLVDDVYTTGSTLDECAKALKKAGVKQVIGLTLSKSVNKIQMEK